MSRWTGISVLALVFVAGACGGNDTTITPRASRNLSEQIDLVEFTIAAGEYGDARRGLDSLREETIRLAANDAIGPRRAPAILVAVHELQLALDEAEG